MEKSESQKFTPSKSSQLIKKDTSPRTTVDIIVNLNSKKKFKAILPKQHGRHLDATEKREQGKEIVVYKPTKIKHIVNLALLTFLHSP